MSNRISCTILRRHNFVQNYPKVVASLKQNNMEVASNVNFMAIAEQWSGAIGHQTIYEIEAKQTRNDEIRVVTFCHIVSEASNKETIGEE